MDEPELTLADHDVAGYAFEGTELVYSDPPYLKGTRTSRRRYRYDYEEADHVEWLELLKALPCPVMVSGYPSALYDERLARWRRVQALCAEGTLYRVLTDNL